MSETLEKPFVIGKFPDEGDSVALLHDNWLDGDICYWPNERDTGKVQTLIKKGQRPTPEWRLLRCTPIRRFSTYEQARRRLPDAEETSDVQSDIELPQKRRSRVRRYSSDSDDGFRFDSFLPLPSPPAPDPVLRLNPRPEPNKEQPNRSTAPAPSGARDRSHPGAKSCSEHSRGHDSKSAVLHNELQAGHGNHAMPSSSGTERDASTGGSYFTGATGSTPPQSELPPAQIGQVLPSTTKEILRLLHAIQFKQDEHTELLSTLLSRTDEERIRLPSEVFGPFDDLEAFLAFDASVASSEERKKQLMLSWSKCGGSSGPDMTRRILLSLLSDAVAVNYSLLGGKGKLKFCELACWKAMKDTVKAKKDLIDATDYNVEQAVKSWLAHAKERLEKAAKKACSTSSAAASPSA